MFTDSVRGAGQDERGGDAARDRERVRVVVGVEAIERAHPRQDGAFDGIVVAGGALERGRRSVAQMGVGIDDAAYVKSGLRIAMCALRARGHAPGCDPRALDVDDVDFVAQQKFLDETAQVTDAAYDAFG